LCFLFFFITTGPVLPGHCKRHGRLQVSTRETLMQPRLILFMCVLLGSATAHAGDAGQADVQVENAPKRFNIPRGMASGYPPPGGKGPGSGHSYQQGTAGPGQGSPNYQGGHDVAPAPVEQSATGNVTQDAKSAPAVESTTGDVMDDAGSAPANPSPAVPGPYGNSSGLGYPYNTGRDYPHSGGRGRGYGRYQRGYGYGYPGYRGLGGGRYPHHRQFGNPPLHPEQPAASKPTADTE
jgi:hypothetical protein